MSRKRKSANENNVIEFDDIKELENTFMYITETTKKVKIFFGILLRLDDKSKMAILLYLFSK